MPTNVCTDGTVCLAGGSTPYEGRMEVCAHGTWGTQCGPTDSYIMLLPSGLKSTHLFQKQCNNRKHHILLFLL